MVARFEKRGGGAGNFPRFLAPLAAGLSGAAL